ncbi:NADP-dependent oxidoreductase [Actinocrinis sp.]|uniref:NADP-dependent oxidoreductase n=1 Tax=Actinocrinis sp. TaxID=1920516 RepID=UPI002D4C6AC2|nr:NADP-dependent oxidoreductase [Actinocrinis sp.]HZP50748.1 NADP-dependent oxidoreductase [Actinocrinis sp.]
MPAVSSRVIRFHEIGEPLDVLRQERIEIADPPGRNVRVRVLAAGLNPADWELCRGFMPGTLPRGIGYDVAGTVEAVGPDVAVLDEHTGADREPDRGSVGVGDVVFGTADFLGQPSAGAADVAILNNWFPLPAGLDPVQSATLPMVVQTAAWTLELMDLRPGATLLVHGAGGMVGYAAVQIALRHGARVIATAGPTFTADLEGFGARVTTYGEGMPARVRALTGGHDVDLVLDTPRPSPGTLPDLIALAGGDPRRVVTISNHEEARSLGARVNIDELRPGLTPPAVLLPRYALLAAQGAFRLPIAKSYPLEQWREAVQLSLSGNPHGKVVLLPGLGEE